MAKNPLADKAYELYKSGMKLTDIAKELDKPAGTVRRWKSIYKWDCEQKASVRVQKPSVHQQTNDGTKETFENKELTPRQQLFCVYYSKNFNATQSYMKAFECSYDVANAEGYKMLVNPCVRKEISRLKEIKRQQIIASEEDLLDLNMRIAFSDIGNYVSFEKTKKGNRVDLADSEKTDTQIIKEIKMDNKGGITISLKDDRKAMEWLDKHYYEKKDAEGGVVIQDDIPNEN